jgi:hypothetical protein
MVDHQLKLLKHLSLAWAPFLRLKANASILDFWHQTPTNLSRTDVIYLSIPIANGEDPEPSIEPYLNTILSLANISEPLFKVFYAQHVTSPISSTPGVDQPSICVSPPLVSHLAEIADSASPAAESLFFRVIDLLKAKNPQMWTTESTSETGVGGDIFSELKVPMWPPSEGPREDESGDD